MNNLLMWLCNNYAASRFCVLLNLLLLPHVDYYPIRQARPRATHTFTTSQSAQ